MDRNNFNIFQIKILSRMNIYLMSLKIITFITFKSSKK